LLQYAATIKSCEDNHLQRIITADNRQNVTQNPAKSLAGLQMRQSPSWPQKKIIAFGLFGATKHADFKGFSTTTGSKRWPIRTNTAPKATTTRRNFDNAPHSTRAG
jgi:hypothetical protein